MFINLLKKLLRKNSSSNRSNTRTVRRVCDVLEKDRRKIRAYLFGIQGNVTGEVEYIHRIKNKQ